MGRIVNVFRRKLHPLLLKAMPSRKSVPVKELNFMPDIAGNKLFAINHSCVLDCPVAAWVIKEHFYYLMGKQRLQFIDRLFFLLNGVIYVDRKNKKSKRKSKDKLKKLLLNGKSILIFLEGTWNLTPSKPLLPMNWGIIELARETGKPIIPIIMEYGTDYCYVKYGEAIFIEPGTDKGTGIQRLEETLATMRWDIWELLPIQKRFDKMKSEFEEMIQKRVTAYSKFDLSYEMSVVRER